MRLHEEYLKRHHISVPIIKHVSLGYLIVRDSSETCFDVSTSTTYTPVNWTVLKMKWEDPIYHPGHYVFKFLRPAKSATSESDYLRLYNDEIKLRWDEYEDFLLKWFADVDASTIISDPMEIVMTVWEMFVYSHERHIVEQCRSLSNLFFRTLDFTANLPSRYSSYTKLLKQVNMFEPPFNMWQRNLTEISKNYSPWLAKLYA